MERLTQALQIGNAMAARAFQRGEEATPAEGDGLDSFVNTRGARLQTRIWQAAGPPRAVVVFCHGYGTATTQNQAWQRVGKLLSARGLLCAGLDYPGHGASEGRRNRLESVAALAEDVLQFIDETLRPRHPDLPIFLRGQSLGGLVALSMALQRPALFSGLALGAPAYELRPLIWAFAPRAITEGGASLKAQMKELAVPVAVFQGVQDSTVSPAGARHLIQHVGSEDRSLYLYDNMGHNMSIEPDVCDWLLERIEPTGASGGGAATLHIRRPVSDVKWKPQPPGSEDANANTELETVHEPAQQASLLDKLLRERSGGTL